MSKGGEGGASMRITIIGAGAIGSVIGGLLSKSGADVTLIGRKPHVEAINQNGLILDRDPGRIVVTVEKSDCGMECRSQYPFIC